MSQETVEPVETQLDILREVLPGYEDEINNAIFSADLNGWYLAQVDLKTYMLGFKREDDSYARINLYLTKSTFVTQIRHPKRGKGQLFRRNVWLQNYHKIFANPRVHTGRGYHRRSERK